MALPAKPIIKKFFTNKIESSKSEWGDYLLEIADIFSMFDGEELDRDLLADRFSVISGRSSYALRDVSNFRDEFGAYGTYLGLFHIKLVDSRWIIRLSKATKHFLCSTEPDVESFCRTQLALFQYPNGAGLIPGSCGIQGNIRRDTVREIEHNIRLNPFRLLCRLVITLHELDGIPLDRIHIPYSLFFMLVNDDAVNHTFSPSLEQIKNTLTAYEQIQPPTWTKGKPFTNFKRNFHIFEWTGIFKRVQNGLVLQPSNYDKAYEYIKIIGNLTNNFDAFESCYHAHDIDNSVRNVIKSSRWGEFYDALTLPMDTLVALSDEIDENSISAYSNPIGSFQGSSTPFPALHDFHAGQIHTFTASGNCTNPYETLVRREKANREHSRILNMLAALIRANNYNPTENTFIDMFVDTQDQCFIFEVKSNNERNTLSQIRKAISQLYEYRYRSSKHGAILCIVLQQKPTQPWIEDYLINDRNILLCWLVDDVRLECPDVCHDTLSLLGIVE